MIESDDVHMCKLYNRIYDLKMNMKDKITKSNY